jgi:hypothetical protein
VTFTPCILWEKEVGVPLTLFIQIDVSEFDSDLRLRTRLCLRATFLQVLERFGRIVATGRLNDRTKHHGNTVVALQSAERGRVARQRRPGIGFHLVAHAIYASKVSADIPRCLMYLAIAMNY